MQRGPIEDTPTNEMFPLARLAIPFALGSLVKCSIAVPPAPLLPRNDASVSDYCAYLSHSRCLNILEVSWGGCGNFGINSTDPNFQCGFLEVPMDYFDDSAGSARLAVIKYSATAPKKLGTIFFNPGHPLHSSLISLPLITRLCRRTWRVWPRISLRIGSGVQSRFPRRL